MPVMGVLSRSRVAMRASSPGSRNCLAYACWSLSEANARWLALKNAPSFRFQSRNSTGVCDIARTKGLSVSTTRILEAVETGAGAVVVAVFLANKTFTASCSFVRRMSMSRDISATFDSHMIEAASVGSSRNMHSWYRGSKASYWSEAFLKVSSAASLAHALGLDLRFSMALEHEVLYLVRWPLTALARNLASSNEPGAAGAMLRIKVRDVLCLKRHHNISCNLSAHTKARSESSDDCAN